MVREAGWTPPAMVQAPAATGSKQREHLLCSSQPISSGLWRTSVLLGSYNSAFMTLLAFLIPPEHFMSLVSHCPRLSPEPITGQCRQPVLAGLLPPVQIAMARRWYLLSLLSPDRVSKESRPQAAVVVVTSLYLRFPVCLE